MSSTHLTLNLVEGSVSFSFSPAAAQELKAEINSLMQGLKAIATHPAPGKSKVNPQKSMEYQHTGEVFLEIFLQPPIFGLHPLLLKY